jgi:hypothetical protein
MKPIGRKAYGSIGHLPNYGSFCAVAMLNSAIVALGRAGWQADTSPYEQHRMFDHWVASTSTFFAACCATENKSSASAQAHSTYILRRPKRLVIRHHAARQCQPERDGLKTLGRGGWKNELRLVPETEPAIESRLAQHDAGCHCWLAQQCCLKTKPCSFRNERQSNCKRSEAVFLDLKQQG